MFVHLDVSLLFSSLGHWRSTYVVYALNWGLKWALAETKSIRRVGASAGEGGLRMVRGAKAWRSLPLLLLLSTLAAGAAAGAPGL